jgi:hypothetical protein
VNLWDLATRRVRFPLNEHSGPVISVAFASGGDLVAAGSRDGVVKLWSTDDGRLVRTLPRYEPGIASLAASPDGRSLAAGGADGNVVIHALGASTPPTVWPGHSGRVYAVAFSADGRRIASASAEGLIKVRETPGGRVVATFLGDGPNSVFTLAFAPDGTRLATAGRDPSLVLRELIDKGRETVRLPGEDKFVEDPDAAPGATELDREMSEVARQVKLLLDQKGQDAIAVGDFHGPARLAASSGPAIRKAVYEALRRLGVAVRRDAGLMLRGEYRDFEDRSSGQLAILIRSRVVDRDGAEIVAIESRGLFGPTSIAALAGMTVALPPEATDQDRSRVLRDSIEGPQVHVVGARVSARPESPYAIEVLVNRDGQYAPRPATRDRDGFAFVSIARGELYAVRLINDSPLDAAVTLTIDGLSVFAFSEKPSYTSVIVPARSSSDIKGWFRTTEIANAFQVNEYAKSAAAEKLPDSGDGVGTITAGFAATWPKGDPPPEGEASAPRRSRMVTREVGKLRAAISVRYAKDAASGPPTNP